ncbi:MAG: ABC transporter permease [Tannerellaceae bacterium]|nr:ABC transporter permease [Tannerellaceae bacterium]
MLTHYIKVAWRNMRKHSRRSLTAVFGLAFGIACFVPALYWVRYETSYDSFYPGAALIYRIYAVDKLSGKVNELAPGILERKMHEHIPGTETSAVFFAESNNCSTDALPHIRLQTINTGNNSFFRVFEQEFISGDAGRPLQVAGDIVLTESAAARMFGDAVKAVGQPVQSTLYFFNPPYTVTAVVKDPPPNTNLPFDAILFNDIFQGIASLPEEMQWGQFNAQMYVRLHPGSDAGELAGLLRDFTSRIGAGDRIGIGMEPLSDVRHSLTPGVFALIFIRLFVAAGALLLFGAMFNCLNLHLDLFRGRRHGLRIGTTYATNGRFMAQKLSELAFSILPAMLLAGCLIAIARPFLSKLLDVGIGMPELLRLFAVCGGGVTVVLILAVLIQVLKGGNPAGVIKSE